jgi:pantoate--beta-alanine ligase
VRDQDGLALSSRNARLSADERARALALPRALLAGLEAHRRGGDPRPPARATLASETGVAIEYVEVAPFEAGPTLVLAARVGATRLIDNVPLDRPDLAGLAESVPRI